MTGDPAPDAAPPPADEDVSPSDAATRTVPLTDVIGLSALAATVTLNFAPFLFWMWERWMKSEYYGHGVLVLPIAGYLVWRRREALAALPKAADGLGLVLVVVGLMLHLLAAQVTVNFLSGFALLPILLGLALWLWGRRVALALLFPIAYLAFMVPVDRLLVDAFSSPLQLLAAKVATAFGRGIGMPVTREGVNISLPEYTFEVAIACSGLKSLISMSALAALFAYLLEGRLWRRALIVLAVLPVALVANAARITTILLIAQSLGEKAATGFFHGASGIIVFLFGLLALLGIARLTGCHRLRDDI